ncbi:MAG: hypothetical protein ACREBG_02490 [Pyrinomonadaceae bacterium]
MADATQRLLERYESKRSVRRIVSVADRDPQRWSYLKAAAVLHCFVPESLQPLSPDFICDRPRTLVFDDVVRLAGGRSDGLFTLKPEKRREALREFSSREAMSKALEANPDRLMTPVQKMWESYLQTASLPPPETLGYRQLTHLCQIVSWLEGVDNNLPDQAYLLDLVRRKSVLASFEHLVTSNFTGRVAELDMLRRHCGVLPEASGIQSIGRYIAEWLKRSPQPILAIYGSGGVGKSALIGHILWEQAQAEPEKRIPFAYLAFDQPTLRVDTPFTILVEAAAQFDQQFPEHKEAIERFHSDVRAFRDARDSLGKRRAISSSRGARLEEVQSLDRKLYLDFADLLMAIGTRKLGDAVVRSPVLLALDTFEEVQYRDRESLTGFWRMLQEIHEAYPPFRVVISGRAPVEDAASKRAGVQVVELAELPMPDRTALLQSLGVSDPEIAKAVAEQVGGNPLSLRLAANVITSESEAATTRGIKNLSTRTWLFFKVDEQIIQGQLYWRILDHIHDENVRKLAHPGMVLRRVSSEIILEVLAPLCQISINGLADAQRLFESLRNEHALVQAGEEGTLEYRPEIRRSMIRLLEQDRFSEVRDLHRAAIFYYSGKDGVVARAEEIYHRLVLDEDAPELLDSRWLDGIEQSIAASVEEYPDRAKAWLASRINLEVPRSVFHSADIAEWERNTTRKVQRALSGLQTDWALELLAEREDRSDASPLFALEAKAHLLRNDLESAWAVLENGVERVSKSTNRGRLAELFWLQAQVAILRNEPGLGDECLERAERAIEKGSNPIPLMHILCHRLLIRDKFKLDYEETAAQVRQRLNAVCERIDESTVYSERFVVQLALFLLENEFPKTKERLASLIGYTDRPPPGDPLTSENLRGLEGYREAWELGTEPSPEAAA